MAFGLFRKRLPDVVKPEIALDAPPSAPEPATATGHDSAREILELLELELVAMIRQLERAANSVASGAQSTATTLSAIRYRADALTDRTSEAQATAETFSQAAEKFTRSAHGIGTQVRDASKLANEARSRARSQSQCRAASRILGRYRQCRQPDRDDRQADHAARAEFHHRSCARR